MSISSTPVQDRSTRSMDRLGPDPSGDAGFLEWDRLDGRYVAHEVIGRGGMGTVLRVEDSEGGGMYALKYCRPGENVRRRFVREVRLLSGLRHPNIVPIVDARLDHSPPFFVMPLAAGSLQEEVEILARELPAALRVFREVCLGVKAIHDAGVVHRDLKPSNVLRLADGSIVVADLGAAKRDPRHSSILTGTCAVVGTLAYLAPEQLMPGGSRRADRRSDIYQLGKILYQLATGRRPAVVEPGRLPVGLAHIVGRAVAASPDDRYPDVESLLAALDAYERTAVPAADRRGRLHSLLGRIRRERGGRAPSPDDLSESLSLLGQLGDNSRAGVSWFDALPVPLIRALARDRPVEFLPVLDLYAKALSSDAARQDFRYADFVAARMREIFASSRHVGLRTRAIRVALLTSSALNRYAAMDIVREMLREVKTLALAMPVADMLRGHLDEFRDVADGLDPDRLHPAIRDVLDDLTWIETVSF